MANIIVSLGIIVLALVFARLTTFTALKLQKTAWAKKYCKEEHNVALWNKVYDFIIRGSYLCGALCLLYVWTIH